jgi:hypothetical protein
MATQIRDLTQRALEQGLDENKVKTIVDSLIKEAAGGNQQSIASLVRLLDFQRSVGCW